ncbi:MAG: glycosyltransferase family 2 protein [Planctomycetota bacterium]
MKPTLPVTVLIAVRNEEANLPRCLAALDRAQRVLVVDSNSTDDSAKIAAAAGAEVVNYEHPGGLRKKRQWALDTLEFQTPWVLLLDADEVVPDALWDEIEQALEESTTHDGFLITKEFHFMGKRFRWGGFSHAAVLLIRVGKARFETLVEVPGDTLDMEVHERVQVNGSIGTLATPVIHEDFKGLEAYIDRHNRYSTWDAHLRLHFLETGTHGSDAVRPRLLGNVQERRRWLKSLAVRTPIEPWLWFFYHYILRLGFLHGRAGLIAAQIRRQYIINARAKLYELRLGGTQNDQP